jgi:hypothetical protein
MVKKVSRAGRSLQYRCLKRSLTASMRSMSCTQQQQQQ